MKEFSVYLDDLHAIYLIDVKKKFDFKFFKKVPTEIYIHHTGNTPHELNEVYNMNVEQFKQPSYHFIIDRKGTIYQTLPINVQGAHIQRHNETSFGIALLNLVSPSSPTLAMKYSLESLIEFLKANYPIKTVSTHFEAGLQDINEIIKTAGIEHEVPLLKKEEVEGLTIMSLENYKKEIKKQIKDADIEELIKSVLNQRIDYVKNCPGPYYDKLLEL